MELRADNVSQWDARLFDKQDRADDFGFYTAPRKVVHIDEAAVAAVTTLYDELIPANARVLDLMSSWRSHLPTHKTYARVAGLGMNADEMRDNSQLSEFTVHSLNMYPKLPYATAEFDCAVCCVSVQYLQKPVEVFREVARVLRPGAPFVVTFSNRCFPSKAINVWSHSTDHDHMNLVALYFQAAGGWEDIQIQDRSSYDFVDPLYAVWAFRNCE